MSKGRETGFYWCKRGNWMVCPWNGDHWIIPGYNPFMKYSDSDFTEIDERPIVRDEPMKPWIEGTTERIPPNE